MSLLEKNQELPPAIEFDFKFATNSSGPTGQAKQLAAWGKLNFGTCEPKRVSPRGRRP
jgi:hypothetical protein